ncbi:MAG: hypothetical protein GY951_02630, partial [Psychromonas sp.]|nr:hypothetical protein [Psychromonas sp.]
TLLLIVSCCLMQRAGYTEICTKHLNAIQIDLVTSETASLIQAPLSSPNCDSAEHLLQSYIFDIELLLIAVTFTFGLFVFFPSLVSMLVLLKETRAPPLPCYLMFCVFRE